LLLQFSKKKESFLSHYKWWIIGSLVIMTIGYIIVYLCFRWDGFLYVGIDLEKSDWLAFLGAYLSFAGTVIVSAIAILQGHYYTVKQKERDEAERKKQIQPIFSIDISSVNTQVGGTAEVFNPSKPETIPQHKNVTLKIENVSDYPIRNVIVFEKYLYQLLKPHDAKTIQIAYSDSPDIKKWKSYLIEVLESEHGRSEKGLPMWININYDDIDGNEMFQTFDLKDFDGTAYVTDQ